MLLNVTFLLSALGGLLLVGLLLVWKGLRPRRTGTTPYCRACGYNMTGATGGTCPECGKSRGVVLGERRIRNRRLAAGLLLTLIAATPLAAIAVASAYQFKWHRYVPISVLVYICQYGSDEQRDRLRWEIHRRGMSGKLTEADLSSFIDYVTDPVRPFPGHSRRDLFFNLQLLEMDNLFLSDALHDQIADSLLSLSEVRVVTRREVPAGDPVPMVVIGPDYRTSLVGPWWEASYRIKEFRIDGSPTPLAGPQSAKLRGVKYFLNPIGEPGSHQLEMDIEVLIFERTHGRELRFSFFKDQWSLTDQQLKAIHARRVARTLRTHFEIVARDRTDLIQLRRGSELTNRVKSIVSVRNGRLIRGADGRAASVAADVLLTRPMPIDIAIDGAILIDEQEYAFGPLFLGKSELRGVDRESRQWVQMHKEHVQGIAKLICTDMGIQIELEVPIDVAEPQRVDVILRSCPEVALRSVDIVEIWDGEIRFDDVLNKNH